MKEMPLGRKFPIPASYDPGVLYAIPRPAQSSPMYGFDLWRCYELFWLGSKGKPETGTLEIIYPIESRNIVESKSLKLYLYGISNTVFDNEEEVKRTVKGDLKKLLLAPFVEVTILHTSPECVSCLPGICIDGLDTEARAHALDPAILSTGEDDVEETLFSHLLMTLCPITAQPDFASVMVAYKGGKIDEASLLSYICSYRGHAGFSEECCERIYGDIRERCRPLKLTVSCFYTRRGGIEINPVRSSEKLVTEQINKYRLARQ